ncbi:MAG: DUF1549 domain-containing protein [Planctomycetia bacterium]|nr:DUF1549 domain-containing protein [Planctomycetia bacterium]
MSLKPKRECDQGLNLLKLLSALVACLIGAAVAQGDDLSKASPEAVSARIDRLFEQAWLSAGVAPAPLADDATFLRRVTLDLTGLIPTAGEIRAFQADSRPDKRQIVIADLLTRPRHSNHLARLWREILLPRNTDATAVAAFEAWLQNRFQQNLVYDRLVQDILSARGTVAQSEPAIFFAANSTKPEDLAASSSRAFLGLQVRCAQCHDHPFASWKQSDFWGFAAFYARVQGPAGAGDQTPVDDRADGEVRHPKTLKAMIPQFLDGRQFAESTAEPRRAVLARWITAADNPFFARAAVNRAWWLMFGRGLVQPVDDLGANNPASHPEVLKLLADDFVAGGFDLRRTLQIIAGSKVYQLASQEGGAREGAAAYTAMAVRSLSAAQVYDALLQASGQRVSSPTPEMIRERSAFLAQFDAPSRDALEFQGGIPQVLSLLNGSMVARLTDPTTSDLIAALADSPFLNDRQRIETVFLATVSRSPRNNEWEPMLKIFESKHTAESRAQALGDILWALLNSSEFVLNR